MGCKSSTLAYGVTGVGKTYLLAAWIERVIRDNPNKKVRLYTAEPQGLATLDYLVDRGVLDIWNVNGWPHFQQVLQFASEGYWPKDTNVAGSVLIAPSADTWSKVAGIAHESATAYAYNVIEELTELGANNQITGSEAAPARFKSGDLKLANANQTMYGISQRRTIKAINISHTLPVHILWTAREMKFRDSETNDFAYGPELAGRAATKRVPPLFGNTIHLARVTSKTVSGQQPAQPKRTMFFDEHYLPDDPTTPFLSQVRLPVRVTAAERQLVTKPLDITDDPDAIIKWFDDVAALRAAAIKR